MESIVSSELHNGNSDVTNTNKENGVNSDEVYFGSDKQDDLTISSQVVGDASQNIQTELNSSNQSKDADVLRSNSCTSNADTKPSVIGDSADVIDFKCVPNSDGAIDENNQDMSSDGDQIKKLPTIALPSIFTSPLKSLKNLTKRSTTDSILLTTPTGNFVISKIGLRPL